MDIPVVHRVRKKRRIWNTGGLWRDAVRDFRFSRRNKAGNDWNYWPPKMEISGVDDSNIRSLWMTSSNFCSWIIVGPTRSPPGCPQVVSGDLFRFWAIFFLRVRWRGCCYCYCCWRLLFLFIVTSAVGIPQTMLYWNMFRRTSRRSFGGCEDIHNSCTVRFLDETEPLTVSFQVFIHSYSFIFSCQNATKHELGDAINSRLFSGNKKLCSRRGSD